VGKAALEGRPGIQSVTSGFKGFRETNTVVYDPTRISLKEMESALKNAGTYRGTADE